MRAGSMALGLILAGCPEPVPMDQLGGAPVGPSGQGSGGNEGGPGGNAPGGDGQNIDGGSPPPQAGTFTGDLMDGELEAKWTQEEIPDPVSINGTLKCDSCTGKLLVRVLPPPPPPGETEGDAKALHLLTSKSFDGTGAYSILVPKGQEVVLQVVDDANGDGLPSAQERMGMRTQGSVTADDKIDDIDLEVGVFPEMPGPQSNAPPTTQPTPGGGPGAPGGPGQGEQGEGAMVPGMTPPPNGSDPSQGGAEGQGGDPKQQPLPPGTPPPNVGEQQR